MSPGSRAASIWRLRANPGRNSICQPHAASASRSALATLQVASVAPVGGTFKITAKPIPTDQLRPFLGGAVLLPGLQNEYTVKAASGSDQVDFAVGRINMYVDKNGNGVFDRVTDPWFIGVPSLEKPVGFFSLLYVDRDCVLTGGGSELHLKQGWNVFTVRFPGDKPVYAVQPAVNDIVLDVFLP